MSEGHLALVGRDVEGLAGRAEQAIGRATQYLLATQHARGYWHAPLEANVTMEAEYVFFNRLLGRAKPDLDRRMVDRLVALQAVNHETGVIQPVAAVAEAAHARGALLHVDAVQAVGRLEPPAWAGADSVSVAAHKIRGPKGIGALYVRRKPRVRLEAQMHGGGHERGLRSGTLPTHQIVGMGEAFRLAKLEMATEIERIRMLRDRLQAGLGEIEEAYVNGDMLHRVAHNLNISFNFVEGESLIMAIKDVAVSSGSACTSASLEPSYVLRALGRSDELAHSSIRFTVGRFTTQEEIDFTIDLVKRKVGKLREMSPLWEMHKEGIDLNTVQWAAH